MNDKIVNLKERLRQRKGGSDDGSNEGPGDEFDFEEIAEFVRSAAADIAWLAKLATDFPFDPPDDFSHNFSKRDIVERIGWRLEHLQSEFENLRQRAEQEEPAS